MQLTTPIEKINKIGKATAKKLQRLGIKNIQDLLQYYPVRYDDYTQTLPISELKSGINTNVQGMIEFIQNKRSFRTRMMITEGLIKDATGQLKVVWFNQPFIGRSLKVGDIVSLSGKIESDFTGLQMNSPEYEKVHGSQTTHTKGLVPVYSLTAGLTNKQLRFLIKSVINLSSEFLDFVPKFIKQKYNLLDFNKAIYNIHFPKSEKILEQAKYRLKFNELFLLQIKSQITKSKIKSQKADKIKFYKKQTQDFVNNLPFQLTNAQKKASWEILQDLNSDKPMSRLLEGDVGSGKTVVTALAMLNIALNKKQSALLVPTEILASQHFETLKKLFKNTDIKIGLFTRTSRKVISLKSYDLRHDVSKKDILNSILQGKLDILVGTHALIQEDVEFKNLALAIIDEQHRFGVEQRKALRKKSGSTKTIPHLLSMTATPIPRSLAQVVYGDLDISIINEMPKGRKIIKTFVVPERKRIDAYNFIKKEVNSGKQVFVVCPLIKESDKLGVKSVEEEFKKLNNQIFKDLKIAYLHGKLKAKEKDQIMQDFLSNKTKILISTSVIEVGVDVPNATIMIIEGAERFGMAQLHQFRGRVGRNDKQSYCLLFSTNESKSQERLATFASSNDGFKLAEADLKMRGPGEVYGAAQTGFPEFKIASLDDYELIKESKIAAEEVVKKGIDDFTELTDEIEKDSEWLAG